MKNTDKIMELYLNNALYYFDFDLLSGIVEEDIIGKDGVNLTKILKLTSPCLFDELITQSENELFYEFWHIGEYPMDRLTKDNLIKAYNAGVHWILADLYVQSTDNYRHINIYLLEDEVTGNPRAYICCMDSTSDEKQKKETFGNLKNAKIETDNIVASAKIGIWKIYLYDGEAPRFKASQTMYELMGIEDGDSMSDEELYDYWYSRIKKSSMPSVNASVAEIIEKGFSENSYTWKHPTKGDTFVRCGGTSKLVPGKGYVLSGYHSDITDTVNAEAKQKQLLADALEEVKKQKLLLQDALDNYKEADYDRRRDFLTGLRNRQDMFDLLQDALSGRREKINAMFMMDIDSFKMLNDHYGHTYGDECLAKIGAALNDYSELHDIYFYRYGGEEILGISFDQNIKPYEVANDLVKLVSGLNIKRDDVPQGVVTISLGYTNDNKRYEKMIDKADTAMYKAKGHGKNQAICFEEI